MTYTRTSLAIVEYKIDEARSQRNYYDTRIKELIKTRDKIIKKLTHEESLLKE